MLYREKDKNNYYVATMSYVKINKNDIQKAIVWAYGCQRLTNNNN